MLALACLPAAAQLQERVISARSLSGQFVVQAPAALLSAPAPRFETNQSFLRLEPSLLPVSCERVKQAVWREVGFSGTWSGKVFIQFYQAMAPDDSVTLVSDEFRDGWQYRLALPNVIDRTRLARALVRTVLLEIANRSASQRSAELPPWLVEGLAERLLVCNDAEIFLVPPKLGANGVGFTSTLIPDREMMLPLAEIRKKLQDQPPLSFEQLSWPTEEQLNGTTGDFYRANALLFLSQLLQLPDGRACLRNMLGELPRHYNWQFALLRAFSPHFQRPLDVEKWWTICSLHVTGRELSQTFGPEESWQQLDQLVRSIVLVRSGTNQLGIQTSVSLQTIVRDWERSQQQQVLRQKLAELNLLRPRVSENLVALVGEYCRVLSEFTEVDPNPWLGKKAADRQWREKTVKELDLLERKREALRTAPPLETPLQAGRIAIPSR